VSQSREELTSKSSSQIVCYAKTIRMQGSEKFQVHNILVLVKANGPANEESMSMFDNKVDAVVLT